MSRIQTTDLSADPGGPLLTPEQVGQYLQMSPAQLAQWRYEGRGPRYTKLGRVVRYDRADLLAWVRDSTRTGTAG